MGYNPNDFFKKSSTSTGEVVTTYDPSVITRRSERKVMSSREIADYSREASRGTGLRNAQSNMGLSSSMGKSDRQTAYLQVLRRVALRVLLRLLWRSTSKSQPSRNI